MQDEAQLYNGYSKKSLAFGSKPSIKNIEYNRSALDIILELEEDGP